MEALNTIAKTWAAKITKAREQKWKEFGKAAEEAMRFYTGPYDFLYEGDSGKTFVVEGVRKPTFRMSVNKVAELVQLYVPVLYHRNPTRNVTPKMCEISPELMLGLITPEQMQQAAMMATQQAQMAGQMDFQFDPMTMVPDFTQKKAKAEIKAKLMEHVSNQFPAASNLKAESRAGMVEALIKGRGIMWTEVKQGPKGLVAISTNDSVDYLQTDPDVDRLVDAKWISRERTKSVDVFAEMFGLDPKEIRGHRESTESSADVETGDNGAHKRKTGQSYDVITYHEIYSRMGLGGRLSGVPKELKEATDMLGQECYIVIADGMEYPANLPPSLFVPDEDGELPMEEIKRRVEWPTPFYTDEANPWPCSELDFHHVPKKSWPMAHITPAMGELKALNWIYSFLVGKIKNISRDFIIVDKAVEEDIKEGLLNGPDLTLLGLQLAGGKSVSDYIQFQPHPPLNSSIWDVVSAVERSFEKRTGLTELAYGLGGDRQMRSAKEAEIRDSNVSVRPDDMANATEDWASVIAKKEILAFNYHADTQDIAPMFAERYDPNPQQSGEYEVPSEIPYYTNMYEQLVGEMDLADLAAEFSFNVESGSGRKPNRGAQIDKATEALNVILPQAMPIYMQTGKPQQVNYVLRKYFEANEWNNVEQGLFPDMTEQVAMQQQAMMGMQEEEPQEEEQQQQGPPQEQPPQGMM